MISKIVTACESVFIDILFPKTKPILVGVCYRPPNEGHYFDTLENKLLSSDKTVDQETILMGDFNVHYSNKNNSSLMRTMKRFMSNFDLDQLIDKPTRVTPETNLYYFGSHIYFKL